MQGSTKKQLTEVYGIVVTVTNTQIVYRRDGKITTDSAPIGVAHQALLQPGDDILIEYLPEGTPGCRQGTCVDRITKVTRN